MHGDVATALDHNLLLPLFLGVAMAVAVRAWAGAGVPSANPDDPRRATRSVAGAPIAVWWLLVAATAVFFVVRNLPWFPFLDSAA
jgi:ribose/xylose/arabinose/galactoside ABC-type transport system permease subunit